MKKISTLFICALAAIAFTSCNDTPPGGVALIDLDQIAKRLGRDTALVDELRNMGAELSKELETAKRTYSAEFEKNKAQVGTKPTEADTQKLNTLLQSLNAQLQQQQQQAQQEINTRRVALVNRFREEVMPTALAVAKKRGLSIVLLRNDSLVLCAQSETDITNEVIDNLIAAGTKPVAKPAQAKSDSPSSNDKK